METRVYQEFAGRLSESLKQAGYVASRSPSGICIKSLSEICGASEQICRRYIRGEALPDVSKINKMATALDISPGWLLFGEDRSQKRSFMLDDDLLHYILTKSHSLYQGDSDSINDYAEFVIELIRDICAIDTSSENLYKIVDLAVDSIQSFQLKKQRQA